MIVFQKNLLSTFLLFLTWCVICIGCQKKADQSKHPVEEETTPITQVKADNSPTNQQILLVTTNDWSEFNGNLRKYQWQNREWVQIGKSIPIVVGGKGLAWGKGSIDIPQTEGPIKKEGDKKSPAGIFELGTAFGYSEVAPSTDFKYKYLTISPSTMCIEDQQSNYYNQIIDETSITSDWTSTDHMLRKDDLYEWGVFVNHNSQPPVPGKGSCIFLHIWRNENSGTAGCTAMEKDQMKALIEWLDLSKNPLLVQVPISVYFSVSESMDLPQLK